MGDFEIGVNRHRFDFGPADQIIAGVVTDLKIFDLLELRALLDERAVAIVKAQIVIVGRDGPEDVVPHHLGRHIGVIRVDQWKRLARDITDYSSLVFRLRETCAEYFSVASLYGGGQSTRSVGVIFSSTSR